MKARAFRLALAISVCSVAAGAVARAQSRPEPGVAAAHVAAATAAAGQEYTGLFNRICTVPVAPAPQAAPQPPGPPDRARWYAEPVKVFDNLYFVGERDYTAWAVLTSDGIVVIDPIFEYSVEEEVVHGLTKLGADPKRIRYVLVSHAHRDHAAGERHPYVVGNESVGRYLTVAEECAKAGLLR